MDVIKKGIFALVLLLIVAVAWVSLKVYFDSSDIKIDPNASAYTKQLDPSFRTDELDSIIKKSKDAFPVTPEEFLSLIEKE